MKFCIGMTLFAVITAFTSALYHFGLAFVAGVINSLCYITIYHLGFFEGKSK